MPGNLSTPGVSVASRVFALLGAFGRSPCPDRERPRPTVGLPVATAHRLAAELVELGGLERRGKSTVSR